MAKGLILRLRRRTLFARLETSADLLNESDVGWHFVPSKLSLAEGLKGRARSLKCTYHRKIISLATLGWIQIYRQ